VILARAVILVIVFSSHAEQKLAIRRIRRHDVERIIAQPDELFEDRERNSEVAVGKVDSRFVVAVFRRVGDSIKVITVYHTRKLDKLASSKLQRGAWRRVE
jgi:uncharacterized DUF497 family protein